MFVVFALGLLSMSAAQPPAQLSIPNVRVFTGARVIDRATITVADGKILSPQQPTRLFQSLDHDDSEPILKTRVVNALPADGWRFSKPPPFSNSRTAKRFADSDLRGCDHVALYDL